MAINTDIGKITASRETIKELFSCVHFAGEYYSEHGYIDQEDQMRKVYNQIEKALDPLFNRG